MLLRGITMTSDERHVVSNHRSWDCLFNRLSGPTSNKHQTPHYWPLFTGIHRSTVNSSHKRPVMRKKLPFDDVMRWPASAKLTPLGQIVNMLSTDRCSGTRSEESTILTRTHPMTLKLYHHYGYKFSNHTNIKKYACPTDSTMNDERIQHHQYAGCRYLGTRPTAPIMLWLWRRPLTSDCLKPDHQHLSLPYPIFHLSLNKGPKNTNLGLGVVSLKVWKRGPVCVKKCIAFKGFSTGGYSYIGHEVNACTSVGNHYYKYLKKTLAPLEHSNKLITDQMSVQVWNTGGLWTNTVWSQLQSHKKSSWKCRASKWYSRTIGSPLSVRIKPLWSFDRTSAAIGVIWYRGHQSVIAVTP